MYYMIICICILIYAYVYTHTHLYMYIWHRDQVAQVYACLVGRVKWRCESERVDAGKGRNEYLYGVHFAIFICSIDGADVTFSSIISNTCDAERVQSGEGTVIHRGEGEGMREMEK